MIYLTGDVHSKKLVGWEQKLVGSEVNVAKRYLEVLKKYKVPCTLFINGICLDEEKEGVKELLNFDIELGGHTYDNFGKDSLMRGYLNRKIFGCVYGSSKYQKKDVERTKTAFEKFGMNMESWRTHSFGSNDKTFEILKENGVKYVSDLLGEIMPLEKGGIIHLPINIPVDVVTIAYGETKPENRNPFASCTKGRIHPEEWFEIMKKRVKDNERKNIPSILLLHPSTMFAIDEFVFFEKVIKFLSKFKCYRISQFELKKN